MTATDSAPAGWYPDPEDPTRERYWSGTAWSQDRRARPTASPTTPRPPNRKKKHWRWSLRPLAEIAEELRSPDPTTRAAAARSLQLYHQKYDEQRLELEIACLRDPDPAVRYWALEAMLGSAADSEWLVSLLLSDKQSDAEARASLFADITTIGGPDSVHRTAWMSKEAPKRFFPVIGAALLRAGSPEPFTSILGLARAVGMPGKVFLPAVMTASKTADSAPDFLSILTTARTLGLTGTPTLFTPWAGNQVPSTWPDRCCVCGKPHPDFHTNLIINGKWYTQSGEKTVSGWLRGVPVCTLCGPSVAAPDVRSDGLHMRFPSDAFVAELIQGPDWSLEEIT